MDALFYIFIVSLLAGLYVVVVYNRLVALRQTRGNAFADIEVQLKLRYDLIPNLVETVKGYAAHEKSLFEQVTNARSKAMGAQGVNDKIEAETGLNRALMNLLAVAENYPDLKANENFGKLQAELSDIENKVAAARRFFNNATAEYNTMVRQFPAVLFAGKLGFSEERLFEVSEEEKKKIDQPAKVSF